MNKVMLLNLPIQAYIQKDFSLDIGFNPSLGLASIGTWLELNGINPIIIDLNFLRLSSVELLKRIDEEKPILIGMSVYTENLEMAIATAKFIKQSFPLIKIVFGGPHPTLAPEEAIRSEYVDFVIRKEGEPIFIELVEAILTSQSLIKFESINGLVFKYEGNVINNRLRKPITDLDILPIPKREIYGLDKYSFVVCVSTSRGCPGRCIYCSATALSGATYRTRNIDNVFLEVVLLRIITGNMAIYINIIDDTFTALPERVFRFTYLIKRYNAPINWTCESRIDAMTEELLDEMSSAKCISIQYGIESGNQEVLDKIQKGMNLEYAKRIIDYSHKKNIVITLSFILGHYCDTKETMQDTINFIKEMYNKYNAELALSFNTPFPGTWQYTHRKELEMTIKAKSYKMYSLLDPIVETKEFSINDQRIFYCKASKYLARYAKLLKMKKIGGIL